MATISTTFATHNITQEKSDVYTNVLKICDKYFCELITSEDMFEPSKIMTIKSSCGHISQISPNKFIKQKIGVYCENCYQKMLLKTTTSCFKCNTEFTPTNNSFLYCSKACAQFRGMTEERKKKIQITLLKRDKKYIDEVSGDLKSLDEISEIQKKRKREKAREKSSKVGICVKDRKKIDYDTIKSTYESNGCQLLTTEDEYLELRKTVVLKKILFKIISSCGHLTEKSLYYSFTENNTGKLCSDCIDERLSKTMKEYSKTEQGHCRSFTTQKIAIGIIAEICKSTFTIKKTREGCDSDILVKPIDLTRLTESIRSTGSTESTESTRSIGSTCTDTRIEPSDDSIHMDVTDVIDLTDSTESGVDDCDDDYVDDYVDNCVDDHIIDDGIDEWLKIKIKSTDNENKCTKFKIEKIYDKSIVLMISTSTKEMWIFYPHELEKRTYYMGRQKSKYEKHIVKDEPSENGIISILKKIYDEKIYNTSVEIANIPLSTAAKLEYAYVKKRENTIKFLDFRQNEINGLVYNFRIGDLKVQEITFSKQKNRDSFTAGLNKNMGGGLTKPYVKGDNDLYWLNLNDSAELFYVIPESVLIKKEFIQTDEQPGRKYLSITKHSHWLESFKFSYLTINKEKEKKRLCDLIAIYNQFVKSIGSSTGTATGTATATVTCTGSATVTCTATATSSASASATDDD